MRGPRGEKRDLTRSFTLKVGTYRVHKGASKSTSKVLSKRNMLTSSANLVGAQGQVIIPLPALTRVSTLPLMPRLVGGAFFLAAGLIADRRQCGAESLTTRSEIMEASPRDAHRSPCEMPHAKRFRGAVQPRVHLFACAESRVTLLWDADAGSILWIATVPG